MEYIITSLSAAEARPLLPQLYELLRDAVDSGASVGFLPPLPAAEADEYWQSVVAAIEAGHRVLLVAEQSGTGELLGTVQLDLATRPNSLLRAEVSKLLVHTQARRRGVARQLLEALEAQARQLGRSTLVLDTRHGDGAEVLYQNMGYQFVGAIPAYFINHDGLPHATAVYYKLLAD
ncbi:GNAT family N-acetyltransferase [Hymenobacter sp. DH14]|uniref:GNAT family N-acetyltransferase n=1 Tax=Hymenobacter cyanobacteriorum TaxID=2926463 RepID=A0A9X1VMX1_9BACT|nr:GNAT family N-acetyltransferase [Hymenobacter cyanobacteriorum]MCI1189071.1 GNAT family N-acetyltransferase [Hymenobacter cyanobacteriorum]